MIRERIPSGLPCLLVAIGIAACADSGVAPHIDTITEASLSADLYALSHDSMAGAARRDARARSCFGLDTGSLRLPRPRAGG